MLSNNASLYLCQLNQISQGYLEIVVSLSANKKQIDLQVINIRLITSPART